MKKKILILALSILCLAALLGVVFVANADETPETIIAGHNLSLDDSVQIIYYVKQTAPEGAEVGVLCWFDPQESYTLGNAQYKLKQSGTQTIGGYEYAKYTFPHVAAKMYTQDVYAVSYVKVGDTVTYSKLDKYSVLQYCQNKKNSGSALGILVDQILDYGAAAQIYFDFHTERLANADYYEISVKGGVLEDGTTEGLYQAGETITLKAIAPENAYVLWKNSAEEVVGTTAELTVTVAAGETYTSLSLSNSYNSTYGYEYLGTMEKGADRQTLYKRIDNACKLFHLDAGQTVEMVDNHSIFSRVSYADLSLTDSEAISVWKTVKDDCPLYYWLSNTVQYSSDKTLSLISVDEYADGTARIAQNQALSEKIDEYVAKIDPNATNYQKALAFHDWIIEAVNYTYGSDGNPETADWAHSVVGVFAGKGAVCESYARSFQLLLNVTGVENIFVSGRSKNDDHAWNLVKMDDGSWYWFDLTYDDLGEGNTFGVTYTYFCATDSGFLSSHTPHTTSGTYVSFLYDLPARSATAFAGGEGERLLGSAFTSGIYTGKIVGYRAVELHKINTDDQDVVIPKQIEIDGKLYTVVSLGYDDGYEVVSSGTRSVALPKTVKFIWDDAFRVSSIASFQVDEENVWFRSQDGVLFTKSLYTLIRYPSANSRTEYRIPDETRELAYWSFESCFHLETLTVGKNVKIVGITNWGNGYHDSGNYSFGNIVNGGFSRILSSLAGNGTILIDPENAAYESDGSAIYTKGKTTLMLLPATTTYEIPKNLRYIDSTSTSSNVLTENKSLAFITVEEGNAYFSAVDGVLYNKAQTKIVAAPRALTGPVTIPDSMTNIGQCAFAGCTSLTSITIPDSVTSIGSYAFYGCKSLTSVTIPDSVTSIEGAAFEGCTSLTSVTIGNGVESIGNWAFSGCTSLTSVTIPDSVTSIEGWAFYDCTSLSSVTIGNGVTSIGQSAFYWCTSLTSVTIPDSVTSIEQNAFYGCTSLTSVTIPNSVTSIGTSAFSGCSNLTSITIPDSVTSIGTGAFSYCTSLTSVYITDLAKWCAISFDNLPANPLWYAHNLYLNDELVTNLVIPDGMTNIGQCAFAGCTSLTSITIPDSVTSIGRAAFERCASLTSVTIPDSMTSIGAYAFSECTSLTSVTIPDSVTSIGTSAFSGCSNLTSVTIPDSVTSIGSYTFYNCTSLTEIIFLGTEEEWNAISKGNNWNYSTGAYTVHCTNGDIAKS